MAGKIILQTLDGQSDEIVKLAVKRDDGSYEIEMPDINGLKSALAKERASVKQYRGIDPAEYKKLKEAADLQREERAKRDGDIEALRSQWSEATAKLKSEHDASTKKLMAQLHKITVEEAATRAAARA